jgi:quercetin dioxygenase-like cupin family protein
VKIEVGCENPKAPLRTRTGDEMEFRTKPPSEKAGPEQFTGDIWFDPIVRGEEPSRIRVSTVRFAPGARTAWHAHTMGQTLHVTDGLGRTQSRGDSVVEIRAGDTIAVPPGEWHWHGAAPEHFMTHLAISEASGDARADSEWADHVTDAEYLAEPVVHEEPSAVSR